MTRPLSRHLAVETLELRLAPAVLLAESFESVRIPRVPVGWESWGLGAYVSTHVMAAEGQHAIAGVGPANADGRFYTTAKFPADAAVSVAIRTDAVAPVELLARGDQLATPSGRYVSATVDAQFAAIELVEVTGDTRTPLANLRVAYAPPEGWLRVTLQPQNATLTVRVQRLDSGEYLNAQGAWQTESVVALTANTSLPVAAGQVGMGRRPGTAGLTFYDSFTVEAPPAVLQNFDTTDPGTRPAGWAGWTSDGSPGFSVSAARADSAPHGLTASGGSRTTARAWADTTFGPDARAAATVFADSLIPAGVMVRGSHLDTMASSYYAATVVRGIEVQLTRVVNGMETRLGSVKSQSYVSQKWVKLSLVSVGAMHKVVVSRLDTGEFLDPTGAWQTVPQPALELTDTAITGGGFVGVVRRASSAGPVTVDDFHATPAESSEIAVNVEFSQPISALAGVVQVSATSTPAAAVRRVEFRVNGRLRAVSSDAHATWAFDTTLVPNGTHTLTVRALTDLGDSASFTADVTVDNPNVPNNTTPPLPRHYDHIRLASLAYSGTPIGDFERARLADSIDLVIPNPQYAAAIAEVAPATPQLVYSNISNVYQGLLSDWLSAAHAKTTDPEAAFYHASRPVPFSGGSPSSQPVTWFWSVRRDGVDQTAAARGTRAGGLAFAANAGGAVEIGQLDRFREINVTLASPATAGWAGVWEYATSVNPAGTPTTWQPLPILADTTAGLTTSGRITFDPPTDWARGAVYAVRLRTTAGGVAPVAASVLGRDFVGANGTTTGVIPTFDRAADADGDGYLNDAEYARRAAGSEARFVHESRVFYPFYGQMRFAVNPTAAAVREWVADYHARLLAANPLARGIFLDNSNGRLPVAAASVLEPTDSYADDYAALVRAVRGAVPGTFVFANTAGGRADANPVAAAAGGAIEEFLLRPTEATWAATQDTLELVRGRLESDVPAPYVVLDSHPGSLSVSDPRVQAGTLAYYYLAADPDRTLLMMAGGFSPAAAWDKAWIPAVSTDVGLPLGPAEVWAAGVDPTDAALTYKVFRRDYANAMVLYKPRSYATGRAAGTLSESTATRHELGSVFRVLNPDGTVGPPITELTLRNGDGVVLLRS